MARLIRFPARCHYCKLEIEAGKGFLQRVAGAWFCQCLICYAKRNNKKEV